jgi:topoisomerase IV subunit B
MEFCFDLVKGSGRMADLLQGSAQRKENDLSGGYSAKDIEVLEGLEPVRKRPGMYIGGTDERALHHLVAEVLDNAMDEAVAGHAKQIGIHLAESGMVTIRDDGRGIPIDPHPKYPGKSALEVILTILHSGGKFSGKAYQTSGGLHGVGISVVNALTEELVVEVARNKELWRQSYSRGLPLGPIEKIGATPMRQGTIIHFKPDTEIFGKDARFKAATLVQMARSKAYLFSGVSINWSCDAELAEKDVPAKATFHFPGGLSDYLSGALEGKETLTPSAFAGTADLTGGAGRVEWAVSWCVDENGFSRTYCNTVPTPQGGTHESGLRSALLRGLKAYGELTNNKRASQITGDDVFSSASALLSLFIREPQFQGQTKEKLASPEATRLVESVIKDHFDHWLTADPAAAASLLNAMIERAEDRLRRAQSKDTIRKSATRRLRLPGKLSDCSRTNSEGTELFLVEGDSAGGSAKQARNRETQAILPLRGKILNVASATTEKLRGNQELSDLIQALGCPVGKDFSSEKLRYERIIIMTDADVDGAHIAALLMTFFYREIPGLVEKGHLFLARPPLYRISQGGKTAYAHDDAHKDHLLKTDFKGKGKIDISRFKGLGEMMPAQLRETTMDPNKRTLLRVQVPPVTDIEGRPIREEVETLVEKLMGRKAETRFQFIQENAQFVKDVDI